MPTATPSVVPTDDLIVRGHPGWESYTNPNDIRKMVFDADGTLWTYGDGGLVAWNVATGETHVYLPEDGIRDVTAMAVAPDGRFLIAASQGIFGFYEGQWKWETFAEPLSAYEAVYDMLTTPDGSMWFTTGKNILRYDHQQWTEFKETNLGTSLDSFWDLSLDSEGTLWANYYRLAYFDGQQWIEMEERTLGSWILGFAPHSKESVWVIAEDMLLQFNGKGWVGFNPWRSETKAYAETAASAPDGSVWVGLSYEDVEIQEQMGGKPVPGVYHYDGYHWKVYSTEDGLVDNEICAITAGPDGSIWFGSCGEGISHFDGQQWKTYRIENVPSSNRVEDLVVTDAGTLWVNFLENDHSFSRFDGQIWTNDRDGSIFGTEGRPIATIFSEPDGSMWFGSHGKITRFDAESSAVDHYVMDYAYSIFALPGGIYAAGTDGGKEGIFLLNEQTRTAQQVIDTGGWVSRALSDQEGRVWADVSDQGLVLFVVSSGQSQTVLGGLQVQDMAAGENGEMWILSQNNVFRFVGEDQTVYPIPNGNGHTMAIGPDGDVWVSSGKNLLRLKDGEWIDYANREVLLDDAIYDIAIGPDYSIWIGTRKGIYRFTSGIQE